MNEKIIPTERQIYSLESLPPNLHEKVEKAFELSQQRADYIGTLSPTPQDFARVGFDYAELGAKHEAMEADGLEPQVIVTAHLPLAPRTVDSAGNPLTKPDKHNFRTMLANMTADKTIPNNPFTYYKDDGGGSGPGLWAASSVYNEANSRLFQQELDLIKREAATGHPYVELDGIIYTTRLIPGTDKPQDLHTDHTANQNDHSTISELLTQNIDRIMQGEQPAYGYAQTWAYGTFGDGSGAARVDWNPGSGQLGVYDRGVSCSVDSLGRRRRV